MRTFSKRVAAVVLSAAVAGAVFAPSIAQAEDPVADCTAQVGELQSTLASLTTALPLPIREGDGELPLPTGDPLAIIGEVQTQVMGLISGGCLPAVPPASGTEITQCTDLAADLLADLSAAIAALVNVGAPDPTAVLDAVTKLTTTLTGLISGGCLPAGPTPPLPPLPI